VSEPAPGTFAVTSLPVAAGDFELCGVPAGGTARLVGWRSGAERDDPRTWRELARAALRPGGRAVLE
jgi:hypothetical protein